MSIDYDSLSDEELSKRILELKKLKLYRLQHEDFRFFSPIGRGQEFVDLFSSDNFLSILLSAANGVGKTSVMVNLLANLFWPVGNINFQGKLFKNWDYSRQGRIISQPNTIIETILPMIDRTFPRGRFGALKYTVSKQGKRYPSFFETDTGWSFTVMTYEQEVKEFESANLGWFWEDEPPPPGIHQANIARLRNGGVGLVTETPLDGSAFLYQEYIDLPDEVREKKRYAVVTATLEDACIEHGINGFWPHEQVERTIMSYDPDEREARAYGVFKHLQGVVFKKFNPAIHVIKPFPVNRENFVVVEALDSHTRNEDAVLWVAIDQKGRHFVVDELWGHFETGELAQRIKHIANNYRVVKRVIDPSAFIVDQHTGKSLQGDLAAQGVIYEPASKQRSYAIQLIKDYLDYEEKQGLWIKPPKLFFFDTCPVAINQTAHWQWDNWRNKTAMTKKLKEKPVDKDDHMIEDLGRVLLSGATFQTMPDFKLPYNPLAENRPYQDSVTNLDPYVTKIK